MLCDFAYADVGELLSRSLRGARLRAPLLRVTTISHLRSVLYIASFHCCCSRFREPFHDFEFRLLPSTPVADDASPKYALCHANGLMPPQVRLAYFPALMIIRPRRFRAWLTREISAALLLADYRDASCRVCRVRDDMTLRRAH